MEKIISILVLATAEKLTQGKSISNGLTLKYNPIFVKDDVAPSNGPQFAKIYQETSKETTQRRDFLSKAYFPHNDLATGCTNQVAKILFPSKQAGFYISSDAFEEFIKVPIISQPFPEYKMIVATAPWPVRITGSDAKPVVVYIVFPDDDDGSKDITMPSIYFVRKESTVIDLNKKEKLDPVLIIDNNRTVTGIKSKAITKFIKFKNKANHRYDYTLTR